MAAKRAFTNKLEAYKTEPKGKVPPNNMEAEQCLLGSVLLKHEVFDSVAAIVNPPDFYEPRHIIIFETMKELYSQSRSIDSLTVAESLATKGQLEQVGGVSYVSSLADSVPTYAHATEYAEIVRNKAMLRNMIDMSTAIVEAAYREEMTTTDIIQSADEMLFRVSKRTQTESVEEVREKVSGVFESIIERSKNPDAIDGLQTGFRKIDECTTGLKNGQLVIIAARPGIGKTSLAINIAYSLAVKHQKNILIFSFEMSSDDLIRRMLAVGSRVHLQNIRMGRIDSKDKAQLMHAAGALSETNIFIDTADNNVYEMRAKTRAKKSELEKQGKTLDLVVIDYMQLVKPNDSVPREQQISQISRGFKTMAMELKMPVIALSQLNREVEKREKSADKTSPPRLSDLRESGAIEQDADLVIFIHRDGKDASTTTETYESGESVNRQVMKCKLIIAKNRNGPVSEQGVWFIPELTLFQEMSSQDSDEAGYGSAI
jgi:replicative DNA helicase